MEYSYDPADVNLFSQLVSLEVLGIRTIRPSNFTALVQVCLSLFYHLIFMQSIAKMTRLTSLELCRVWKEPSISYSEISPIVSLPDLKKISLYHCPLDENFLLYLRLAHPKLEVLHFNRICKKEAKYIINICVARNNLTALKWAQQHSIPIYNPKDESVENPLITALHRSSLAVLKWLLKEGIGGDIANISVGKLRKSALHLAVETGSVDMCIPVVEHGASIDAKDSMGRTPLFYALDQRNNDPLLHYILGLGVNRLVRDTEGYKFFFFHLTQVS